MVNYNLEFKDFDDITIGTMTVELPENIHNWGVHFMGSFKIENDYLKKYLYFDYCVYNSSKIAYLMSDGNKVDISEYVSDIVGFCYDTERDNIIFRINKVYNSILGQHFVENLTYYMKRKNMILFIFQNIIGKLGDIQTLITSIQSQINSLKTNINTLKKDYIIDSGLTDDNKWYYRKWSSGKYECWCSQTITTAVDGASGAIFTSDKITLQDFPITFVSAPVCQISLDGNNGYGGFWYGSNTATKTSAPKGYILRATKSTTERDFKFNIYAYGRWK